MLAKKLRGLNPSMRLVFYYNANLDLTDYKLYNLTAQHAPDWWLRDENGKVLMAPIDCAFKAAQTPQITRARARVFPMFQRIVHFSCPTDCLYFMRRSFIRSAFTCVVAPTNFTGFVPTCSRQGRETSIPVQRQQRGRARL